MNPIFIYNKGELGYCMQYSYNCGLLETVSFEVIYNPKIQSFRQWDHSIKFVFLSLHNFNTMNLLVLILFLQIQKFEKVPKFIGKVNQAIQDKRRVVVMFYKTKADWFTQLKDLLKKRNLKFLFVKVKDEHNVSAYDEFDV